MEYSPIALDVEGPEGTNLLATCRELGVAFIPYSPLGRGLLTSTFSENQPSSDALDFRWKMFPRFLEENREANVKTVNEFKALADKKGCSIPQLGLAWLLKQGDYIFPIPGTKKIERLEDNWGALQVKLTDAEEAEVRKLFARSEMVGERLPEKFKHVALMDTKEES